MIKPTKARVINTDRSTHYPDASDHNAVFVQLTTGKTNANFMTFNVRRYAFDLGTKYDWDVYRDHECAQLIHESGTSVLALQECEKEQDAYLAKKLPEVTGVPWLAVNALTNVGLMFKSDRWNLIENLAITMDNGDEPDRRFVVALLESVKTKEQIWFGSTHFGVGAALAERRRYQARRICEFVSNVPGHGDISSNIAIGGDFNDYAGYTVPGVRREFHRFGFLDERDRLSDEAMDGDSLSTKHTFGKLTPRDGRQIDAVFTKRQ